jgi:hypothetical protein
VVRRPRAKAHPLMRDPEVGFDPYYYEAVCAIDCLLPLGSPMSRLVYSFIDAILRNFDGEAIRQSDLNRLQDIFAEAVDEAESETPLRAPQS